MKTIITIIALAILTASAMGEPDAGPIPVDDLKDAGFTAGQIEELRQAIHYRRTESTETASVRLRGTPAGSDLDFAFRGMAFSITDDYDPAELSKYLYIGAVILAIGGVVAGKFFGWGVTAVALLVAVGLGIAGRILAESLWVVLLPVSLAAIPGGLYIAWRLYQGKEDHDTAAHFARAVQTLPPATQRKIADAIADTPGPTHKHLAHIERLKTD